MPKKSSGFSYLEIIIGIAVLSIIAHAFFTLINATYYFIGLSRAQSTARALANQQMETIRNLPYDDVGTVGGIPSGPIEQNDQKTINNQTYSIQTTVIYVDDPFDGTAPADLLPSDYKRVRIKTTWSGPFATEDGITLLTNIVPRGVESIIGGGTLAILVFDSTGQPVPQADVTIRANTANPPVDLNLFTDNNGNLILPGAPPCTACYEITVTKSGYSTDQTVSSSVVENPLIPFQTVLESELTQVSFAIDKTSQVTLQTKSYPDQLPLPNTQLTITGQKILGTDIDGNPIYKYNSNITTDSNGNLLLELEWDTYQISLPASLVAGANPLLPLTILPDQSPTAQVAIHSPTPYSLSALVQNASGSAIASAEAKLTNGFGFEEINLTGEEIDAFFGYAFFSLPQQGNYTLEVTHPDYQTATNDFNITSNDQQTIILNDN